ncbi:MAG: cell division protein FtsA [Chloroflexi bacterium]|nr:cell division protein FtsA [Chloroflexota bacterium]
MGKEATLASIDVGTAKVCALVGHTSGAGDLEVLGVGVAPAQGLRKGVIINIEEATRSIRSAVEKAERSSGTRIVSAMVGIAGGHISALNNHGVIAIPRGERVVSDDDVARVLESARTVAVPDNREVLHVIPRCYTLDGQEGVTNPVGMHGFRLEAETHIVSGASTSIQNLIKCIQSTGIEIDDVVAAPLAASEAVLAQEEKEIGVVLADIGGGTTDVALFVEGSVWHTAVLPVGGHQLTNDIAIGFRTPFVTAEEIKVKHGHAVSACVDPEETIDIACFGAEAKNNVPRRRLAEIIRARMEETLEMILLEIRRSGHDGMLPAGLVLTGGTANLKGIENLASDVLKLPARVGMPRGIHGLVDTVSNPAYATSTGLLLWAIKYGEAETRPRRNGAHLTSVFKRATLWFRDLLP